MLALQRLTGHDDTLSPPRVVDGRPSQLENGAPVDTAEVSAGPYRVLIVEDDPTLQAFYSLVLRGYDLIIDQSLHGHEALEKLSTISYDLVITDLNLPGLDGISLLQWIQHNRPTTLAVVISGDGSAGKILDAMRAGARDYLVKPVSAEQFEEMIQRWTQPQRTANRQIFSSLMKQVLHDVRGEIMNLEFMIQHLPQPGKSAKTKAGGSSTLAAIQGKIEQLKELTTEYCTLSRSLLQGGFVPTERIELKDEVIAHVLGEMQPALERKEITLAYNQDLSGDSDAIVMGNRVLLKSLFRTLFSNAIRHCIPSGTLSYGISSNGRRYKFHVANEGEIVPVHQQASLFDEFVQIGAGKSPSCQNGGLGLGLAMAKDIVRQHGGDIWYESVGNGSKFVCTLPSCQQLAL